MKPAWIFCMVTALFVSLFLIWARREAKKLTLTNKEKKIKRRLEKYGIKK